jgi:hypothetical protein
MSNSKMVNSFGNVILKATYGPTFVSGQQSDNPCKKTPGYQKFGELNKCGQIGCYTPRPSN